MTKRTTTKASKRAKKKPRAKKPAARKVPRNANANPKQASKAAKRKPGKTPGSPVTLADGPSPPHDIPMPPKTEPIKVQPRSISVDREMLLSALPHPIFVLDNLHRFVYVSSAGEAFFETSTTMLRRLALDDVVKDTSPLFNLVKQVATTGATLNEYAVEISTKRFESPKLVDVYAGPIAEQPELTIVILQQRQMVQMIERQLTHRAAARSVSGMASILAHEIKNPLSGIRGAAQLLEQNLSDDDRMLSRLICTETDRINNLVDRMEVFGDERPIVKTPVNIHDVLEHVRNIAMAGFATGIQIAEEYDPSLPLVPGDRDQLVQAFLNLIKNAAEALVGDKKSDRIMIRTAFRPGIRLTVPGTGSRVSLPLMIHIEDNGSGIPEHLKPHLFDPFVSTKISGTGLGLALVAKIVADHGGVIECESETNKTVFRVLLPMSSPAVSNSTSKHKVHAT